MLLSPTVVGELARAPPTTHARTPQVVLPRNSQQQSPSSQEVHYFLGLSACAATAVAQRNRHGRALRGSCVGRATAQVEAQKGWDQEAWIRGYESAVSEECYTVQCSDFPNDLRGTYFRNGPAKFKVGSDQIMHPFDGDGMVTAVTFDGNGHAHFRNRFVRTKGFVEELAAGKMLYRGQFSLKAGGMLANAFDLRVKNLANTNVIHWAGGLVALWEGGKPTLLDSLSLATKGETSLAGALTENDNFTAHPRYDARTGRLVGFQYAPNPVLSLTKVSFWEFADNGWDCISRIDHDLPGFGFFHDFLVTDNFYILSKAPVELSNSAALEGLVGMRSMGESMQFDDSRPGQLVLVPRDGSPLRFVDVEPHFCFHFSNGYEQDGQVVIDMVQVPDLYLGESSAKTGKPVWETADFESMSVNQLVRYTVDPVSGAHSKQVLCSRYHDFPSVPERFSGRPYRYAYCGTGLSEDSAGPLQGLLKVDTEDPAASELWLPQSHEFLGEPVFCPRSSGDSAEDSGYIVSFLLNGRTLRPEIAIFDAQKISAGPICRAPLQTHIPHGLHGCWVPDLTPSQQDIEAAWKKVPTSLG
eukprot:TRINITY_DN61450_c0_g1_i1.p1 TRINITY_DN61450_c0_g1~~TRINITY_DN61450_c0_g1_i1.p1  ORF type:complete len:596 (+),score=77.64 TRINITY_DN61450_c0_g1_i1:38-1789(+)